jgi:hypothetical protein
MTSHVPDNPAVYDSDGTEQVADHRGDDDLEWTPTR